MTTSTATSIRFEIGEAVVYPAHGVGRITAIEDQEVAGSTLQVFAVFFEHNKMTIRIPAAKAAGSGLRKVAEPALVKQALEILQSRARAKRGTWARRAQECEAKIKAGELLAIAEVVRDLYSFPGQAAPSYSQRMLYEAALNALVREIAAVQGGSLAEAQTRVEQILTKAVRPAKDANAAA